VSGPYHWRTAAIAPAVLGFALGLALALRAPPSPLPLVFLLPPALAAVVALVLTRMNASLFPALNAAHAALVERGASVRAHGRFGLAMPALRARLPDGRRVTVARMAEFSPRANLAPLDNVLRLAVEGREPIALPLDPKGAAVVLGKWIG